MIALRDYQIKIINETRELLRAGETSVLIQSPTASGKTALTAHMLHTASQVKKMRSWFIVHRRELINQSCATFDRVGVDYGIISAGYPQKTKALVQICSIQTLCRRLAYHDAPQLVVWDECHHQAAKTWARIRETYNSAIHIGLTATPCRLDGAGLGKWFNKMICGKGVAELINEGWLSKFRLYAPKPPVLDHVPVAMGDFEKSQLSVLMNKPSITGSAINEYKRLANGQRALLRAVSIEHSKNVAAEFNAHGIPAKHVDGDTFADERDRAIKDFATGKIKVLCNVDLFSEGVDIPAVECAIDLRPTQSLALWLQFCGRVLRTSDGKEFATIIDHAGNVFRHGLPDEKREWSLDDRVKQARKKEKPETIRTCDKCLAALPSNSTYCKYCEHVLPVVPRKVDVVEGDLVEVKLAEKKAARMEQGQALSYQSLVSLATKRGYKNPSWWAKKVMEGRR